MNTFDHILKKYNLGIGIEPAGPSPIFLPDTRQGLAQLFREMNYKIGVEIGVDRGLYAKEMSEANPGVKLYCVDPWKVYNQYADMKNQHFLNMNYQDTVRRLAPYNCEIIKKSSMGAIKNFGLESIDFVFIDGNHAYDYVLQDCNGWSKIVRPGGIVAGHDYTTRKHKFVGYDVKRAVEEHIRQNNIKQFFVFTKRGSSTWFYFK